MNGESTLNYSITEQALRSRIEDLEVTVEAILLEIKQLKSAEPMWETAIERLEQRVYALEQRLAREGEQPPD